MPGNSDLAVLRDYGECGGRGSSGNAPRRLDDTGISGIPLHGVRSGKEVAAGVRSRGKEWVSSPLEAHWFIGGEALSG